MKHHPNEKHATLLYDETFRAGEVDRERAAALVIDERGATGPENRASCIDYSEEAIPERNPAYRMLDGTLYEAQTVEVVPAEVRLALARCLEQLGMSAIKAALVAQL